MSSPSSSPAQPGRRRLLKLGIGAGVLLGLAGTGAALFRPGLKDGHLSPSAQALLRAVAMAVLDGLLPADPAVCEARIALHLKQLDAAIAALPASLRAELSQLLGLLDTAAGRLMLGGSASDWAAMAPDELQQTLRTMSQSSLDLRQQVYHALRDLNTLVFFTEPSSWALVGYPGPREIP